MPTIIEFLLIEGSAIYEVLAYLYQKYSQRDSRGSRAAIEISGEN